MSISPLMTPNDRRRRDLARRRARGRLRLWIAGAVLLAVAGSLILATASSNHGSHVLSKGRGGSRASGPSPPTLSPAGLELGRPPLALTGIGAPAQDALQIAFRAPPRAGLLFNLDNGHVLWQRNARRRMRIASLTKMMTALIAVQSAPPRAHVLVTRLAVESAGSKVGVLPLGRQVRLESMLYGLMLPSGNDAADALAQHISGTITAFVARMNAEAASLGMACTHYSSASGYQDLGNYSCTPDLAELAYADLRQPRLARIVRTLSAALPFPIRGGRLFLYNNNPLLIYHYPGLTGLKTGYTLAAGRCLVATAQRGGVRLGAILLDSPRPATQARQLLDGAFRDVYHERPVAETPIPPEA